MKHLNLDPAGGGLPTSLGEVWVGESRWNGFLLDDENMHELSGMSIKAKKDEVLTKLCANRETHAIIVAEARKGYVEKARVALNEKLGQLAEGKIVSLAFALQMPLDYTRVYDTAIQMLQMSIDPEVELTAQQVRNLVMDQWDWSEQFIGTNALYSDSARRKRG